MRGAAWVGCGPRGLELHVVSLVPGCINAVSKGPGPSRTLPLPMRLGKKVVAGRAAGGSMCKRACCRPGWPGTARLRVSLVSCLNFLFAVLDSFGCIHEPWVRMDPWGSEKANDPAPPCWRSPVGPWGPGAPCSVRPSPGTSGKP